MAEDISSLSSVLCSVEPCLIYKLIWNCIHFQDSLKTNVIQYSGKQCCVLQSIVCFQPHMLM